MPRILALAVCCVGFQVGLAVLERDAYGNPWSRCPEANSSDEELTEPKVEIDQGSSRTIVHAQARGAACIHSRQAWVPFHRHGRRLAGLRHAGSRSGLPSVRKSVSFNLLLLR